MSIQFSCTSCGKTVQVPDGGAGKNAKCPHCAAVLKVPSNAPAARLPGQLPAQIDFPCPSCKQAMRVPAAAAGKQAKCPMCSTVVSVPSGPSSTPPTPRTPTPRTPTPTPPTPTPRTPPKDDLFAGFPSAQPTAPQPAPRQQSRRPQAASPAYPQNPYAVGGGAQPAAVRHSPVGGHSSASSAAKPPAIALLVVTLLWIAWVLLTFVISLIGFFTMQGNGGDGARYIGEISGYVIILAVNGIIVYGCISMMQLRNRGLALTAMILAVIPCFCSPMGVVGIPFGIWGLIVLNNPNVKRAFH